MKEGSGAYRDRVKQVRLAAGPKSVGEIRANNKRTGARQRCVFHCSVSKLYRNHMAEL